MRRSAYSMTIRWRGHGAVVASAVAGALAWVGPALAETEAEHKGGMPQLDPTTFAPQIIWLLISFAVLYYLMSKVALPRLAEILEDRDQRMQSDMSKAAAIKAEADEARATLERAMAEARGTAQAEMRAAAAAIAAETATRDAQFMSKLNERTRQAEGEIAAAKQRALTDVHSLAVEVAGRIVAKIAGAELASGQMQDAVDSVLRERG